MNDRTLRGFAAIVLLAIILFSALRAWGGVGVF